MKQEKLHYLDGLRGIGALMVVLNHFMVSFYPAVFTGEPSQINSNVFIEQLIAKTPLNVIFSGNFAVCIFFILSGYVLTYKFFRTGDFIYLQSGAVKRYFRLVIPVFISSLIIYFLMKLHLFHNVEAAIISKSDFWLGQYYRFNPSISDALYEGFYGAFFKNFSTYNGVLWTMTYEFYGSILVFACAGLVYKLKNRIVIYLVLIFCFGKTYYLGFIFGLMLSDFGNSADVKNIFHIKNKYVNILLLLVGIFLGSYSASLDTDKTMYHFLNIYVHYFSDNPYITYHLIGAFLLLIAILNLESAKKFLSTPLLGKAGKLSFSFYLLHLGVLFTFSCFLMVKLVNYFNYFISFFITLSISLVVIITISFFYEKYIDSFAVAFSNKVYKKIFYSNDGNNPIT